ncbi:transposase [Leptospira wolbachii]
MFSFSNNEFVIRYIKHIIPQNIKSIRYSGFYTRRLVDLSMK